MIGNTLRELRNAAGLSQRDLAKKLDLSHQQIQKYERGENALPLERVQSFATALGVSPSHLAFPEVDGEVVQPGAVQSPDRSELLRLYDSIPDKKTRKGLLDLLRTLGELVKRLH